MGKVLTVPMGNVLTARVGKVLDIYKMMRIEAEAKVGAAKGKHAK